MKFVRYQRNLDRRLTLPTGLVAGPDGIPVSPSWKFFVSLSSACVISMLTNASLGAWRGHPSWLEVPAFIVTFCAVIGVIFSAIFLLMTLLSPRPWFAKIPRSIAPMSASYPLWDRDLDGGTWS